MLFININKEHRAAMGDITSDVCHCVGREDMLVAIQECESRVPNTAPGGWFMVHAEQSYAALLVPLQWAMLIEEQCNSKYVDATRLADMVACSV